MLYNTKLADRFQKSRNRVLKIVNPHPFAPLGARWGGEEQLSHKSPVM